MAPSKTPVRQSARTDAMRAVFEGAGFVNVEPPLLQPADVFLDRSGEDIRRRLFVFNDPGGQELCLRPDLTIPTCRLYLDGNGGRGDARLCYAGAAFRYDATGSGEANEFIQTGAEFFGGKDAEAADAEMLALTTSAARAGGLDTFDIKLGDLALFDALVDALDIPSGWRSRLKRHFWRPAYFKELIARLATNGSASEADERGGLIAALAGLDEENALNVIEDVLGLAKIAPVGGRSVAEIAERFLERAADQSAAPLSKDTAKLIDTFMSLSLKPKDAARRLRDLAKGAKIKLDAPIAALERRFELIDKNGVDLSRATFETGFGRKLEYYTGFVFELSVGDNVFAGGGRYDGLLQSLGAKSRVPAVGCAITLERLTAAIAAPKGRAAK
ncbi:MAG: ATP phosphoribosyltransferase regulatory subunit [Parvibaculum sp.]|nr:ATP phosphoribosyltransferase regulatory subunit [Parvibaculum sp.]